MDLCANTLLEANVSLKDIEKIVITNMMQTKQRKYLISSTTIRE